MFQLGALLFQFVVVILEYLDQFFEIVNFLFVMEFDLVKLNAVVIGHICHLPKSTIFSNEVLNFER